MVQFSADILDLFGAPQLSKLTRCGSDNLPKEPNYLDAALWNYVAGSTDPRPGILHLDLTFLRRANAAAKEYTLGREPSSDTSIGLQQARTCCASHISSNASEQFAKRLSCSTR
jgi:hypothetical protein